MAKKNDNTLLWIAALSIGGYLLYKHQSGVNITPVVATGTQPGPQLALPPSTVLTSSNPANNSSVTNAPTSFALDTTNLVPVQVNNNMPVLQPGQTIAVSANGSPVVNNSGMPLVFTSSAPYTNPNALAKFMGLDDEGECL